MKKIILLVATIYLLIAPITYHPDTKLVLYYASLGNEKVWNIYKYLNENIDSAPKFHYPPMNYWMVKAQLPLIKIVGGESILKWLATGSNIAFLDSNILLFNLASKLPILILLMITGWILYLIGKKNGFSENRARLVALIWYLNPITLFSGVIMGQNDILAIMPFVAGLYFYFDYPILAFLLFGFGGSIKSFPLIWAVALAGIYPTNNFVKKVFYLLISIVFYGLTLLPFIKYDYFIRDVINSGLAMRMFEQKIVIGQGFELAVVPLLLVLIALIAMYKKMGKTITGMATMLVTINFAILSFSNFNPQWFLWIMPFLSVLLALSIGRVSYFLTLFALAGLLFLFEDKFLYWGLVSPINSSLMNLPLISEILLSRGINIGFLSNMFRLTLEIIAGYWLYQCAKFKK